MTKIALFIAVTVLVTDTTVSPRGRKVLYERLERGKILSGIEMGLNLSETVILQITGTFLDYSKTETSFTPCASRGCSQRRNFQQTISYSTTSFLIRILKEIIIVMIRHLVPFRVSKHPSYFGSLISFPGFSHQLN